MTKIVSNNEYGGDDYIILRHLFSAASLSSITDRRWNLFSTYSESGKEMMTEYINNGSGDKIQCRSFDYKDGQYNKHCFTFTPKKD